MFACPYSRSEMVKEKKNYWTSCPVNRTELVVNLLDSFKFYQTTPSPAPFPPMKCFFLHSLNFYQLCVIMEIDCYS